MRIIVGLLAALLLGIFDSRDTAAFAEMSGDVVRLGVLTDISSGNSDTVGMGSVEAARMAVEDAGGTVAGRKVEVLFADHQGKPDIGAGIARGWLDRDGVDAIVDVPQSAVALAIIPLVEKANRVALFSGAGIETISGRACSPNTVQWTFDTYSLANATARALVAEGGDTWFFISADYAFGQDLERAAGAAVRVVGGRVLGAVHAPFNTSDFSSYLLTAQASGAKIVALANSAADTITSVKQAHEFGLTASGQRLAGLLVDVNDVHVIGLPSAEGLYVTTAFYWDRTDASRAFAKRFQMRVKRMPTMIQAGVYSAVRHYLRAVDAAGTDAGDRVVAQMKALPVPAGDPFAEGGRVRKDGLMVHDMYLMRVKAPGASHGEWDLFEILRTIPADQAFRPLSSSECPLVTGAVPPPPTVVNKPD